MQRTAPSRLRFLLCWALFLLLGQRAHAEIQEALSSQAWSTEEGLPDASVHSLLQARDGYLWFGTEGGAIRFDGYSFLVFQRANEPSFTSDDVSSVAQDSQGALWFGTADGLLCRSGESFSRYDQASGLPSPRIMALAAGRDGEIVVLTGKGLAAGGKHGFHPVPGPTGDVTSLRQMSDGEIRLVTAQGRLLLWRHGELQPNGQLPGPVGSVVLGTQRGNTDLLWSAGARTVTLAGAHVHRVLEEGRDLPRARVQTTLQDAAGRTWIGTSRGLLLLSTPTAAVEPVPALGNESILSLLQDREGNLWVGTEASGLHILRPRKFRAIDGTLGEPVTAVALGEAGRPWIGTRDRGLQRIRKEGVEEAVSSATLTSPVILSLAAAQDGELWAGTPDGLNHLESGDVRHITAADGLPDDFVRSLQVDARGVLWAGTRRGLARIARDGTIRTLTSADGLGSDSVGPILLPSPSGGMGASNADEVWAGTSAGLSHVQGRRAQNYALPAGAGSSIITAIAAIRESGLWVAVHAQGLFLFNKGAFQPVQSPSLPAEITAIAADRVGFLWLRSAKGLFRVSLEQVRRCASRTGPCDLAVSSFSSADGLPSEATAAEGYPELALGADGTLWVATRKGLAVADASQLPVNDVPPPVTIQSFSVDGISMPVNGEGVTVGPGHSRYMFQFVALSFTMPSRVRYRTFLEGFDHDWSNNGNGRTASYTSLPARHYRFRVQAQNNDGVWSRDIASVSFVVKPPLYQRWYFFLGLTLLVALAILGAIRLRERAVQRRFALVLEERNRLAREIHDTLAQDFVSISLQMEIASALLKQQQVEKATAQLAGMRQAIREGLQAARQSIWDLRASAGEDSLPARLTVLVSRYAISGKPPHLTIGGAFRALPGSVEAEVLRIAQESLANIERHARASQASVELQYGANELLLTVKDDGRGFRTDEAAALAGHYGLRGMRERADALRSELRVQSSPGEGTTVVLRVPITEKEARPA